MLIDATIWFPTDFSSNPYGMNMDCLVGINTEDINQGDVHLCYFGPPSVFDEPGISYDLNIRGSDTATCISDLDGMGPIASFSAIASGYFEDFDRNDVECESPSTWTTRNGGVTWTPTAKRPTGGLSPLFDAPLSSLRVAKDFLTSGKALVATHGIDCAISYSADFGIVWNGISQINTCIDEKHDLFVDNTGTIYLSTDCEETIEGFQGHPADELEICAAQSIEDGTGTTVDISADAIFLEKDGSSGLTTANLTVIAGQVGVSFGGVVTSVSLTGTTTSITPHNTDFPVTFSGGGGHNAAAHAHISNSGNLTIVIDNEGSGYTSAPAIDLSALNAGVTSGSFSVTPTVHISTVNAGDNVIWTVGDGTHVGDKAVITIAGNQNVAIIKALANGTIFTMDPDTSGFFTGFEVGVNEDDPGAGLSSGFDAGTHKVAIGGPIDDVYTVSLPDKAATGLPNVAAVYVTDNEGIDLWVPHGAILVTVGDEDPVIVTEETDGESEFTLNEDNPCLTIVALDDYSEVHFFQDTGDEGEGTATYSFNDGDSQLVSTDEDDPDEETLFLEVESIDSFNFEAYSLWRLLPNAIRTATDGTVVPDWERVNSWSLYTCPDNPNPTLLVDWDFVKGTTDGAAVFAVDENSHFIYRSVDKGQTWLRQPTYIPFDDPDENIQSIWVVNPTTLIVGGENGEIWYSNNLSIWLRRAALPEDTFVTDIQIGSNGDLIVAGIVQRATTWNGVSYTPGQIVLARSIAATTNIAYAIWSNVYNTNKVNTTGQGELAFCVPSSDYATSGFVNYSGTDITSASTLATTDFVGIKYTGGIWQTKFDTTYIQRRIDNDGEWYIIGERTANNGGASTGEPAGVTGLRSAMGGPGFSDEGVGMIYAVSSEIHVPEVTSLDVDTNGMLRVKGRVTGTSRAEMVIKPSSSVSLYKLWVAATDVGNVGLYSFGTDCNIYTYTDTMNKAVTGLKVTATTVPLACATCPLYGSTLAITWDAMPNATQYFVVVDDATAWTTVYGANEASEYHGSESAIVPTTDYGRVVYTNSVTISTDWKGMPLLTDDKYNVSVWALKYTGSGSYTMENAAPEILEHRFLTSFGMGVSAATPPAPVGNLMPAAAAMNIPVKPTFQWGMVPNAISYTLQVSTLPDFSTLVAPTPVTQPGTAYAWTGANLAYSTNYYWRVQATTANGAGPWMANVFTTLAAPVSQLPAVIVTAAPSQPVITILPPPVTVNVPAQPQPTVIFPSIVFPVYPTPTMAAPIVNVTIPTATTPIYIWIIVAVGAVLTIAVIVLIIRTRRVV